MLTLFYKFCGKYFRHAKQYAEQDEGTDDIGEELKKFFGEFIAGMMSLRYEYVRVVCGKDQKNQMKNE